MESIEYSQRSRPGVDFNHPTFPYSLDERVSQAAHFQRAKEELESKLKSIRNFYASPHAPAHSGPPNCTRCKTKNRRVAEAYYDFYQANAPWTSGRGREKEDLDKIFNDAEGPQLKEMHRIFQSVLREHLKNDICATQPGDDADITKYKSATGNMLRNGRDIQDTIKYYTESQLQYSKVPGTAEFIKSLQGARNPTQRAQAYINFYCKIDPEDTPQQKNFKNKYARVFESLTPHDEVVKAMKKEAADTQASKVSALQQEMDELQMAFSAHVKAKAKKAEKEQRIHDRELTPRYVSCNLEECPLDSINISNEEIIECAICEWLERKGRRRGPIYYCSVEHAEEDFADHEKQEHLCCMGRSCTYYPAIGPGGESRVDSTDVCGICYDCEIHEVVSFFCSEECYRGNLDAHREQVHHDRDIPNTAKHLIAYEPAIDMEILP
ncbi:hypothetical protein HYFRA_00014121 [Hymenoscyphus fraxineus]|uniref:Uncharacterized protein n=1 Tax=Hymenoscyphus fraxineus TaxID=746836 RepID=A0A9N9LCG9_9HELO|nr:hypothetical protein HYFRA_00014121 [Hymenoscyphus fraxineus]